MELPVDLLSSIKSIITPSWSCMACMLSGNLVRLLCSCRYIPFRPVNTPASLGTPTPRQSMLCFCSHNFMLIRNPSKPSGRVCHGHPKARKGHPESSPGQYSISTWKAQQNTALHHTYTKDHHKGDSHRAKYNMVPIYI